MERLTLTQARERVAAQTPAPPEAHAIDWTRPGLDAVTVGVLASLHRLVDSGDVVPGDGITYRRVDRMIADVLRQGDASAPEVAARLALPDLQVRRHLHAMLRAGSVARNGGSWRFVALPLLSDAAACPARTEVG